MSTAEKSSKEKKKQKCSFRDINFAGAFTFTGSNHWKQLCSSIQLRTVSESIFSEIWKCCFTFHSKTICAYMYIYHIRRHTLSDPLVVHLATPTDIKDLFPLMSAGRWGQTWGFWQAAPTFVNRTNDKELCWERINPEFKKKKKTNKNFFWSFWVFVKLSVH